VGVDIWIFNLGLSTAEIMSLDVTTGRFFGLAIGQIASEPRYRKDMQSLQGRTASEVFRSFRVGEDRIDRPDFGMNGNHLKIER
jgi:hypothetical protein